jgi:hypothetical protein
MSDRIREGEEAAAKELRRIAEREHDVALGRTQAIEEAALTELNNALRALFLLNGGAAVAILAFLGGLVGRDQIGHLELAVVARTLIWFAIGVVLSTLASLAAYSANIAQANAAWAGERQYDPPYFQNTDLSNQRYAAATVWQWVWWIAAWLSLVAFLFGIYKVMGAVELLGGKA